MWHSFVFAYKRADGDIYLQEASFKYSHSMGPNDTIRTWLYQKT